jgi:hypothetical protein
MSKLREPEAPWEPAEQELRPPAGQRPAPRPTVRIPTVGQVGSCDCLERVPYWALNI